MQKKVQSLFLFEIIWSIWNAHNNLIFSKVKTIWDYIYYLLFNRVTT